MRLIDADALFQYGAVPFFENDGFKTADKLYGIIKNAPTIDAVPVVRCKDCKHYIEGQTVSVCRHEKGMVEVTPDDFCSYGERRDEDV